MSERFPRCVPLAYSAVYPSVERLLKVGLSDFVCEPLNGRPMKRNINWNALTPKEMFGMNKAQFADFREHYYGETDFKVFQSLKHCKNFTYTNAVEIVNKFAGESSVRMAQAVKRYGLNLTHTLNYLDKHTPKGKKKERNTFDFEHTAIMWTDYLHFASELKYDFSRTDSDVFFPKDLQLAHDNASANYVAAQDEKQFVKYQKRYEKLKKLYEYSNGKYKIVIPLGAKDIVEEGKVLCHCVGGYASRHMNGKTTIVFMRAADKPNKRLVTIEVNDSYKSICQNYGRKNRCVTKEEKAFIDEWIAWVQAGSKRNKKKPAETAA